MFSKIFWRDEKKNLQFFTHLFQRPSNKANKQTKKNKESTISFHVYLRQIYTQKNNTEEFNFVYLRFFFVLENASQFTIPKASVSSGYIFCSLLLSIPKNIFFISTLSIIIHKSLKFHIFLKMGFSLNFPEKKTQLREERRKKWKKKLGSAIGYNSTLLPTPPICYLTTRSFARIPNIFKHVRRIKNS